MRFGRGQGCGQGCVKYTQRSAEAHCRQIACVYLDHDHVRAAIRADYFGLEFTPVGELDGHFLRAIDHVRIGEDDTGARVTRP